MGHKIGIHGPLKILRARRITNICANGAIFPRQYTEKMDADEAVRCSAAKPDGSGEGEEYGVLLYYKYASVPDLDELVAFYESNCRELDLLGRVRVAPHGVNVTVGGKLSSLEEHIDAAKSKPLFEGTDFKLATSHHPLNDQVAKECGFTSLSIRVVDELVTLSSHSLLKSPEISNAGKHLSAAEFHSVLESTGNIKEKESSNDNGELVLLDARNLYETRIGKFHTPGVETLDPEIRQYSDLTTWIDNNSDRLQGKQILMYCTGGIRCEMASAYIKEKGDGFENVFQLYGGIQRYLEQFPDGGYFKGKNFVFDHRISVGSSDPNILGTCLLCGCCFDDYSPRCRCAYCRMLVLVCNKCRVEGASYVCELCQRHGKATASDISTDSTHQIELKAPRFLGEQESAPPRKLRILCLHGFRQNASGFKGRTASLAKKLKRICDLVFVDGPHKLPFIYNPTLTPPPNENCSKKFAWLVGPDYDPTERLDWKAAETRFDPLQFQHQTSGLNASIEYLKTVVSESGPFDGILGFSQGAAMAALVCAQMNLRFAVLCSGYAPKVKEFTVRGSVNCPSLHIFGSDCGKDRQISNAASRELAACFEEGSSVVIEHDSGHIIPTSSPYIDRVKDFLQRFV